MARRILLLITDLEIGGTPTVVRELAQRLHDPPIAHVEVACLAPWGPVADQLQRAGVVVTALGARGVRDLGVVPRLIALVCDHRIDTVFSFLVHANAVAAAARFSLRHVRFLQSIQTTQPAPRWHWWVQGLAQHAAGLVVVPSPSVALAADQRSGVPAEKIVVIPNAVDPDAFDRAPLPPRDARPFPVGFIGRLDRVKRVPLLLEAMALLPARVHLHAFGDGAERRHIESEIARLKLAGCVTMHGAIADPRQALGQVGLLVLASEAEGFGLVLIEAMAAGVPVVATNVPGVRDVVRHGVTGLLTETSSPAALADAIARLINDVPLRQTLIENGLAEVRHRFDWRVVLPQYRQILRIPISAA